MENSDEQQAKDELMALAERAGPILHEFFDAFLIVGTRAGSDNKEGRHLTVAHSEEEQLAVENIVLMLAAQIVEQRGVSHGGQK